MDVPYFGYGALADYRLLHALTGRGVRGNVAILGGYRLCVQSLAQVPLKARTILERSVPPDFRSYVAVKAEGCEIAGIVWHLTRRERKVLAEWELVEHGWYKSVCAKVRKPYCAPLLTDVDVMGDKQFYETLAGHYGYAPPLNDERILLTIAAAFHAQRYPKEGPKTAEA